MTGNIFPATAGGPACPACGADMGWVIFVIIASLIVIIAMRLAGHKGRLSGSRGVKSARMCPDPRCGLPAGKCQHLRRQAERASGMLDPKKK